MVLSFLSCLGFDWLMLSRVVQVSRLSQQASELATSDEVNQRVRGILTPLAGLQQLANTNGRQASHPRS